MVMKKLLLLSLFFVSYSGLAEVKLVSEDCSASEKQLAAKLGVDCIVSSEPNLTKIWLSCSRNFEECESRANDGDVKYQYYTAKAYERGDVVLKDPMKAFRWYKKAAEQGYKYAQYQLGLKYINGKGSTLCSLLGSCIKRSFKKAAYWIKLADQNGHPTASDIWTSYKLWEYD